MSTHAYGPQPVSRDAGPDGGVVYRCIRCSVKMSGNKQRPDYPWYELDGAWVEGAWAAECFGAPVEARRLDRMIGRLDRLLSEFLVEAADSTLDEPDRQTIKHHADDLIGVGKRALELLGKAAS